MSMTGPGPEAATLQLSFSPIKQFIFSWPAVDNVEYYQLLESAYADEPYTQVGLDITAETTSITAPLYLRPSASYILRSCGAGECIDSSPVPVTGSLAEAVGYFKASNTGVGDWFGVSVALSRDGNTLAVGAFLEDDSVSDDMDNSATDSGAVYVFHRDNKEWSLQQRIKARRADPGDHFGRSVALSSDGNMLVVGAPQEDSSSTTIDVGDTDNGYSDAGAAYAFLRSGNEWSQIAYIKATDTAPGAHFGDCVTIDGLGKKIAVGANTTGLMPANSGRVYVYRLDNMMKWEVNAVLQASNPDDGDGFGWSVAFSGDGETLAIGAYHEDSAAATNPADNSLEDSGAVYIFTPIGGSWNQRAYLKAMSPSTQDLFGYQVALNANGTVLAVAAYQEDSATSVVNGIPDDDAPDSGAVYVFTGGGTTWTQEAFLKPTNTQAGDWFGGSVAIDDAGELVAVGAFNEGSEAVGINGDPGNEGAPKAGAIYVFKRKGGIWSQQAYVKAANTGTLDHLGTSVAFSGDGATLAGSAIGEASNAMGVGGELSDDSRAEAGAVYLF